MPSEKSPNQSQRPSLAAIFFLPVLLITGCSSLNSLLIKAPKSRDLAKVEEAAIQSALMQVQKEKVDYKVQPGDLLEIKVFQEKDLESAVRVTKNGTITFPLIGAVKLGELSVSDVEALLAEKLKEYLINPQVTVFIKEYGNRQIYVLGEVKKPGSYTLPAETRLTVLEAVSLAGGFTDVAAPDRTKILRSLEGKSQSISVEVSAITKRGEKHRDLSLEPNDVVYVPQSFF